MLARRLGSTVSLTFLCVALAGCGGSGGGSSSIAASNSGKSLGGTSVASRMENGDLIESDDAATTTVSLSPGNSGATVSDPGYVQVRNNFLGGVDVSVNGEIFYLKEADQNDSGSGWTGKSQSSTNPNTQQSVAVWNAGKGGRDGLFENEDGQVYHKIIGYYHVDGDQHTTGHTIIGDRTTAEQLQTIERQATYNGYYYANTHSSDPNTDPGHVTGGLTIEADFDEGTVSGTASDVLVRRPGSLGGIDYGDTMSFDGSIDGASYTGSMTSTQEGLDGADITGGFYGDGAQETSGIILRQDGAGVTEGFFTAAQ